MGAHKRHGHIEGGKQSSTYNSWCNMKARCLNPKHKDFPNYGGRGVKVCERWMVFDNFLEDMGPKPENGWAISRKGDVGNYEPGNCQWKSKSENSSEAHRGERQHKAKLNEDKVREIFELREQGWSQKEIGLKFGVSKQAVCKVLTRENWSHVENISEVALDLKAKLDEDKVREIFKLRKQGWTQKEIGLKFGVGQKAVSKVLNRQTWSHVEIGAA